MYSTTTRRSLESTTRWDREVNVYYRFLHEDLPTVEGGGLFVGGGMPGVSTTQTISPGTQHVAHITIAERPTLLFDMGYAYSSGSIHSNPDYGYVSTAINSPDGILATAVTLPYTTESLGVVPSLTFAGVAGGTTRDGYRERRSLQRIQPQPQRIRHCDQGDPGTHVQIRTHLQPLPEDGECHRNRQFVSAGQLHLQPCDHLSSSQLQALNTAKGTSWTQPSPFDAEWANFLIGNANGGFTQASQSLTPDINENLFEMFLQDDWKASRRLTVNLGVRYSYFGQPYDVNNELTNFEPSTYQHLPRGDGCQQRKPVHPWLGKPRAY